MPLRENRQVKLKICQIMSSLEKDKINLLGHETVVCDFIAKHM